MKMLDKLFNKTNVAKEYLGKFKIIYEENAITVYNYLDLLKINDLECDLSSVLIKGEKLRVIYQDPITIKLTGNIKEVVKK